MDKLNEWINFYELKTKDKVEFGDGFHLIFSTDKGFCRLKVCKELGALLVKEVCGDGRFWDALCDKIGYANNLKTVNTFLCRDIKVLARIMHVKILSEKDRFYVMEDPLGRKIEAFPYSDTKLFMTKYL